MLSVRRARESMRELIRPRHESASKITLQLSAYEVSVLRAWLELTCFGTGRSISSQESLQNGNCKHTSRNQCHNACFLTGG